MTVYIDAWVYYGKRLGYAGPCWCHLFSDSLEELHGFAKSLGLRKSWFQNRPRFPHYDIGSKRIRQAAIDQGAITLIGGELERWLKQKH